MLLSWFLFSFSKQVSQETPLDPLAEEFTTFNRQRELERMERERKEAEWEQELLSAMEASSTFSSNTSRKELRLSDSQLPAECQSPGSGLESPSSSSSLAHASTSAASYSALKTTPLCYQLNKPSTSSAAGACGGGAPCTKGEEEDEDQLSTLPDNKNASADSKKQAWAKRRSLTMPEGAKLWKKSLKH